VFQNQAASLGRHPRPETMGLFSPAVVGLECPLHDPSVSGRDVNKFLMIETGSQECKNHFAPAAASELYGSRGDFT
jgi:hypothetical protein